MTHDSQRTREPMPVCRCTQVRDVNLIPPVLSCRSHIPFQEGHRHHPRCYACLTVVMVQSAYWDSAKIGVIMENRSSSLNRADKKADSQCWSD